MLNLIPLKAISIRRLVVALLICGAMINPSTAKAKAGGVDAGGNGIFLKSANSKQLVLWDLYLHDQSFNDSQAGDQIVLEPGESRRIDYRNFRSFAFLKSQLNKWKSRGKNLIGLLDGRSRFIDQEKNPYLLMLIATSQYSQSLQEVSVPPHFPTEGLSAFPAASFDAKTGNIFINSGLWNRAGLISQAALLLHERMRSLQVRFALSNADLQKVVYLLLLKSPSEVSAADFDDDRFSKTWLALHPLPKEIDQLIGLELTPMYWEQVLNCVRDGDSPECYRKLAMSFGAKDFRSFPPSMILGAQNEIKDAAARKIIGPNDPGGLKFVSSGSRNAEEVIPPQNTLFSKMYGVYRITNCRDLSKTDSFNICDHTQMTLLPAPTMPTTTQLLLSNEKGRFFSAGYTLPIEALSQWIKYTERGDSFASYEVSFPGHSSEVTLVKNADGSFEMRSRDFSKDPNSSKVFTDLHFELQLRKQ